MKRWFGTTSRDNLIRCVMCCITHTHTHTYLPASDEQLSTIPFPLLPDRQTAKGTRCNVLPGKRNANKKNKENKKRKNWKENDNKKNFEI